MTQALHAAFAFGGMVGLDFVCARYTRATADRRPFVASVWASAMAVFSGTVVLSYAGDPWMLVPACVGAFLGTYLGAI
jgi:hypothetical protein